MTSQVLKDVEAALPDEFQTAREIWKRMGVWSPTAVSQKLEELYRVGKAERITKKFNPQGSSTIHLYRRARLPNQARAA